MGVSVATGKVTKLSVVVDMMRLLVEVGIVVGFVVGVVVGFVASVPWS